MGDETEKKPFRQQCSASGKASTLFQCIKRMHLVPTNTTASGSIHHAWLLIVIRDQPALIRVCHGQQQLTKACERLLAVHPCLAAVLGRPDGIRLVAAWAEPAHISYVWTRRRREVRAYCRILRPVFSPAGKPGAGPPPAVLFARTVSQFFPPSFV